jgi:1-acyl-sn-glycerol-3-phosphate acyltransferase
MAASLTFRIRSAVGAAIIVGCLVIVSSLIVFPAGCVLLAASALRVPGALPLFRAHASAGIAFFIMSVALALEFVYGVRFYVYGDPLPGGEAPSPPSGVSEAEEGRGGGVHGGGGALLISNHRTRLDWAMMWPALLRDAADGLARRRASASGGSGGAPPPAFLAALTHPFAALTRLHIVLKSSLRGLPFAGWSMQYGGYLFLARRWEEDAASMARGLAALRAPAPVPPSAPAVTGARPYTVLLFPEGTDLDPANRERSAAFAAKAGLPDYDCVLHPRARGFTHTLALLRQPLAITQGGGGGGGRGSVPTMLTASPLAAVYDLTLAYTGAIPQVELALLTGSVPSAVHVHVRAFPVAAVPEDEAGGTAWLAARFAEKEAALRDFYASGGARLQAASILDEADPGLSPRPDKAGAARAQAPAAPACRLTPMQPRELPRPTALYAAAAGAHATAAWWALTTAAASPGIACLYLASYAALHAAIVPLLGGLDVVEAAIVLGPGAGVTPTPPAVPADSESPRARHA